MMFIHFSLIGQIKPYDNIYIYLLHWYEFVLHYVALVINHIGPMHSMRSWPKMFIEFRCPCQRSVPGHLCGNDRKKVKTVGLQHEGSEKHTVDHES